MNQKILFDVSYHIFPMGQWGTLQRGHIFQLADHFENCLRFGFNFYFSADIKPVDKSFLLQMFKLLGK